MLSNSLYAEVILIQKREIEESVKREGGTSSRESGSAFFLGGTMKGAEGAGMKCCL